MTMMIGELAQRAHVNIDTIRYYERRGLIPEPKRRKSGYREFSDDYVKRIRFIKRVQELGFTLSEIEDLLALRSAPKADCGDIKGRAVAKLEDIEEKIRDLQRMKKVLAPAIRECRGTGPLSGCRILEAFEMEDDL